MSLGACACVGAVVRARARALRGLVFVCESTESLSRKNEENIVQNPPFLRKIDSRWLDEEEQTMEMTQRACRQMQRQNAPLQNDRKPHSRHAQHLSALRANMRSYPEPVSRRRGRPQQTKCTERQQLILRKKRGCNVLCNGVGWAPICSQPNYIPRSRAPARLETPRLALP